MSTRAKAIALLEETALRSRMYAVTKEALVMRAATVLELFVEDFKPQPFYERHLDRYGSAIVGLEEPFTDDWAIRVMADAIRLLDPVV
jgi:hypothetical protein